MIARTFAVACVVLMAIGVGGDYTIFMDAEETRRLLGVDGELRYVYNGKKNEYALKREVHIPVNISRFFLSWQSYGKMILYNASLNHSEGLRNPKLSMEAQGSIPNVLKRFSMSVSCARGAKVGDLSLMLAIRTFPNSSPTISDLIHIRRRKICSTAADSPSSPQSLPGSGETSESASGDGLLGLSVGLQELLFYMAVAGPSVLVFCMGLCILIYYLRVRKRSELYSVGTEQILPSLLGSSQNVGACFLVGQPGSSSAVGNGAASVYNQNREAGTPLSQVPTVSDAESVLNRIAIDRKTVSLGEVLLEGSFGKLMTGFIMMEDESEEINKQQVYMKTLKGDLEDNDLQSVVAEVWRLAGLRHAHLSVVVAASLDVPESEGAPPLPLPVLIYRESIRANLKVYLKKCKTEYHQPISAKDVVSMCTQVSKALAFLHRKKIVHADVATRNCVMTTDSVVKLCDAALAVDLFPDDYHSPATDTSPQPVRWMAVEVLFKQQFTTASDVWSIGVLFWEVVTYAQQPYPEMESYQLASYLHSGFRMSQPKLCPDELYAIMLYCWKLKSVERPTMAHVLQCMEEFHLALNQYI